jgi:protein involved in polysaccharide export with SLBB domain
MAGGFLHTAEIKRLHLERVIPFAERDKYKNNILFIDFSGEEANSVTLVDGDKIMVYPVGKKYENFVAISGAVYRPGEFALQASLDLKGLIEKAGGILPEAFTEKAELVRTRPDFTREIVSFNVAEVLAGRTAEAGLQLLNLDKIRIYSQTDFRDSFTIVVDGAVRHPGSYKFLDSITVADLILQAGGFNERVSPDKSIEVYRTDTTEINIYAHGYAVKVPTVLKDIEQAQKFYLHRNDRVFVRENPAFKLQQTAQIEGEILYGGVYSIENNKTRISDLITKAGGFKEDAFIDGFQFKRDNKVVYIDLPDILKKKGKSKYDIYLKNHDYLYVPQNPHALKIEGEVMTPALVLYQEGKGIGYYIDQAGGFTDKADKGRMQVRLPNGKMWKSNIFWCDPPLKPGTSIWVPGKVEKESKFWENARDIVSVLSGATTILYLIYTVSHR